MPAFYEFFAGGGLARAGLGPKWQCLFANDIDAKKGASYAANWGEAGLKIQDVGALTPDDLPGVADLAWSSFPCQDLSLAGGNAGLNGARSGAFWPFSRLMKRLNEERRAPAVIVLENVCGALTSHGGRDFAAIATELASCGYRFGALVIDASGFLPQSRPRLFIVAVRQDRKIPSNLMANAPTSRWHPANLRLAHRKLSETSQEAWVWWSMPAPKVRESTFADVIEEDRAWHDSSETERLLSLMNGRNRDKVEAAKRSGARVVGGVYKRTRSRVQRAEVRFDDVAGCLRTPGGGSSRQSILVVEGGNVRSRLLSPREAARLMGLPDTYRLPGNYNEAYHLCGDGVAVPVVRFLAAHLLEPLVQ